MDKFIDWFGEHTKGCITSGLVTLLVIVALIVIPVNFIRHADSGSIGLKINYGTLTGGQPSVSVIPTNQYVWINPFAGESFVEYSTQQQSMVMTDSQTEGEVSYPDSVKCQDMNGISVNLDVTVQWQVSTTNAFLLYQKVRDMPLAGNFNNDVTSRIVRPIARGAIATACANYQWDEMGGKKALIASQALTVISTSLANDGIIVEQNGIQPGEVHYSHTQNDIIDAKTKAQQEAQQSVFLKQKAQNEADAKRVAAQGDADAIRIVNEQLSHVSPSYLQWLIANKWDGKLPSTLVTGQQGVLSIIAKNS